MSRMDFVEYARHIPPRLSSWLASYSHSASTSSALVIASIVIVATIALRRLTLAAFPEIPEESHVSIPAPTELALVLKLSLPDIVVMSSDRDDFKRVTDAYWARQHREVIPSCFVQPRTVEHLQEAIAILRREYLKTGDAKGTHGGLFTIKGGGAAPATGCSTISGGVVIDLANFQTIEFMENNSRVKVGTGLKWQELYEALETRGLMVTGGRTSPVGVSGLSLQGGISFFSPMHGFVCSTIISYEVVVANGSVLTASETSHPELWRALKGGSNNFGVVTSFTMPCFPAEKMWFSCDYMLGFQAPSLLKAFHLYAKNAASDQPGSFDECATVPITCFGYTDAGFHVTANYLGYTKPLQNEKRPAFWKRSPFGSLWNIYSTSSVRTVLSAVKEQSEFSPAGNYNVMAVTTIKNDFQTLQAAYTAHRGVAAEFKHVKGLVLSMALQPILPQWMNRGFPNSLGLEDCTESLIIVEITAKWDRLNDDELVRRGVRRFIEKVDAAATANQAGHRYRFTNYCAEWQYPMRGYGRDSQELMQAVSSKYDPDGLFQRACRGGFKLS